MDQSPEGDLFPGRVQRAILLSLAIQHPSFYDNPDSQRLCGGRDGHVENPR